MEDNYEKFEPLQTRVKATSNPIDSLAKVTSKAVENYYKPTPFKWRLVGDSILIVGSTVTTVAGLLSLSPYVVAAGAIFTALGKILTNFTSK